MRRVGLLLSLATTMATAAVAPDRLALLADQQQVPLAELQAAVARAQLRQEVLQAVGSQTLASLPAAVCYPGSHP